MTVSPGRATGDAHAREHPVRMAKQEGITCTISHGDCKIALFFNAYHTHNTHMQSYKHLIKIYNQAYASIHTLVHTEIRAYTSRVLTCTTNMTAEARLVSPGKATSDARAREHLVRMAQQRA